MILTASKLGNLLTPVLPLASNRRNDLPALASVLIEQRGSTVTATATDRYRAGISRVVVDGTGATRALIRATDLKVLLRFFKPTRYDDPDIEVTVTDGKATFASANSIGGIEAASLTFATQTYDFPDIPALIVKNAGYAKSPSTTDLMLTADLLASFQSAVRDGHKLHLWPSGQTGPVVIRCGDHFIGLLMSAKREGAPTGALDGWSGVLPAPEKERAA